MLVKGGTGDVNLIQQGIVLKSLEFAIILNGQQTGVPICAK